MKSPLALESTVLFIDDEADLLEVLTFQIKDYVKGTLSASSAEEGLKIVQSNSIDLVVTDFKMPDMNGVELIDGLRKIQPDLPILMLTGFKEETAILKALNEDLFDIIEKPIRPEVLMHRIQNALLQSYLLDQLTIHYQANIDSKKRLEYEKLDQANQRKALYRYAGMMPRV